MTRITRWDPFAEMADLHRMDLRRTMDRMFDLRPFRIVPAADLDDAFFPIDVLDTGGEIVVKASLPGVKPEDIEISVTGQTLTVKAETKEETEEKAENWYRRERRAGSFVRQLDLPSKVDADAAQAHFEHGVLRLTLPKAETAKPKTIKVQTAPAIEAPAS
ncbi:MAG: Hsp20/alpha crystallin family protein [Chloroflexi bacterium]|nr:Hsp20/alpha crystallin family protein [Chloroflexota bacterium]